MQATETTIRYSLIRTAGKSEDSRYDILRHEPGCTDEVLARGQDVRSRHGDREGVEPRELGACEPFPGLALAFQTEPLPALERRLGLGHRRHRRGCRGRYVLVGGGDVVSSFLGWLVFFVFTEAHLYIVLPLMLILTLGLTGVRIADWHEAHGYGWIWTIIGHSWLIWVAAAGAVYHWLSGGF